MTDHTSPKSEESIRANAIAKNVTILSQHAEILKTHSKAVEEFQAKWESMDAQAKALLKGCWDCEHRKWEEDQKYKHKRNLILLLSIGGVVWLGLLAVVVRWLEGAISDIGKYGAVVLCVFLVMSLSAPATVVLFFMRNPHDE